MGADRKQLRTRIKSVDSTLHLTKAMGLAASSRIRRAMDSMHKGREYAEALEEAVSMLTGHAACRGTPYLANRQGKRVQLIVIAGDRGLAGGYNADVFRLAKQLLQTYPEAEVIPIGKKACERFGGEIRLAEKYAYADALSLADRVCRAFAAEKTDRVGIVCTKYRSMMSQEAYVRWLLPLEERVEGGKDDAVWEPDARTVLQAVVPEYTAGMLFACVRESHACEVAARRVAMDSAGKNAQEMLDRLAVEYNRARQSAITQEITEIVAGI